VKSIAVNRILDTNGSQILGRLNANGQVWLINPNGLLFGRGAQVNVGGLVASTLDVSDDSLAGSTHRFAGKSTAGVINQGHISASEGGSVVLLGHHVSNTGTISARLGTVALGAGNATTLQFEGNRLVNLRVDENLLDALADNGGLLQADGGQVLMSAGARNSVLASVVNNTGVIEARTVEQSEGRIVLLGGMAAGTTHVAGTLDASAPDGGFSLPTWVWVAGAVLVALVISRFS
jgi:filamentous hemagglutinin family protein